MPSDMTINLAIILTHGSDQLWVVDNAIRLNQVGRLIRDITLTMLIWRRL